ncbi:MAG TPA: hypothetical protein VKU02_22255, partial [Gemmataceae bacterium]|nr:hypothetical protein [Gemmataceae bacterium]
ADDLRRYLNRFAILARRAGPVARLKKWVKRNPALTAVLGCLLLAVLAAGLFAFQAKRTGDLLRQKHQVMAVDKAILDAMSGDAESGLRSIAQAEQLGAEPGQLNMLRGLVELHRGHVKEALVHLEQADKQWPDRVAVKALLAMAYLADLQYLRYTEMCVLAEHLGPRTPEDFIFFSQAQAGIDPRRGLATLDRAPARARQSPVARLVRAIIQTWYAQMTGRIEDAEEALRDIDRVELPDNPLLLNMHVQALLTAAHAVGPDRSARDAYWNRAGTVAKQLTRFPDLPIAIQGRCMVYDAIGDDDTLLEVVRQGRQHVENATAFDFYEYDVLYRRKQFGQALASARARRASDSLEYLVPQAVVLVALGQTAEAERLLLRALDIARRAKTAGATFGYLYLLGPGAQIDPRQAARDALEQSSHLIPDWRNGWYRDLLKFNAGQMGDDELVAKAQSSCINQCEGYFYIGLHKLAEGKRAEAKKWFQKSVDTGVFAYDEYLWSRAFLANIDDPNWLPWAIEKK